MVVDVTNSAFCIKAFGHVSFAFDKKKNGSHIPCRHMVIPTYRMMYVLHLFSANLVKGPLKGVWMGILL